MLGNTMCIISKVAFLASALGPRVAASCAHESLASLTKENDKEGPWEGVGLSPEKLLAAAKDGLAAAAMKSKFFVDHKEREIQRLSANIINHQWKRLELKLKQFAEIKTLLMSVSRWKGRGSGLLQSWAL